MPKRVTPAEFLKKALNKHKNRYIIDMPTFTNTRTKMRFVCDVHGEFWQRPNDFLKCGGCAKCGGVKKKTTHEFIQASITKHGDVYDYTNTVYVNAFTPVDIICNIHGPYKQPPHDHLNGHGCWDCGVLKRSNNKILNYDKWATKAIAVWGDKYEYTDTYTAHRNPVDIICKLHGTYSVIADAHIYAGAECPICVPPLAQSGVSKAELEVSNFVKGILQCDVITSDRKILNGKELDIYIPSKKIAIEFHGVYWHSELFVDNNYHKDKFDKCAAKGIRLIQIFEDEWDTNKKLVKNKLMHILNIADISDKVYARKTKISVVAAKDRNIFYDKNHIQGTAKCTHSIGLYYDDELVACMSFIIIGADTYLNRYATNRSVIGGFSKLLKYYLSDKDIQVVSFADLRWSNAEVYLNNGWTVDSVLPPDYYYLYKGGRKHKSGFRRKSLAKILGDDFVESQTEHENCLNNGIYRIYDAGKLRIVYNK